MIVCLFWIWTMKKCIAWTMKESPQGIKVYYLWHRVSKYAISKMRGTVMCKMSEAIKGQPVVQKEKRRKSTSFITDPTKRRRFDQRQVKQMKKKV
eukprot:gene18511-20367_t